jgi:hypothetical protein
MFPGHQLIQSKMADLILQEFFRRNLLSVPKKFKYNSMCCNGSGERKGNKLRSFTDRFLPTSAKWQEVCDIPILRMIVHTPDFDLDCKLCHHVSMVWRN